MLTPDLIADHALLTLSRWQRETSQQVASRLLYRDQARRWEANDNHQDHYGATLNAVRLSMGQ